jgi:hypothetical protein
LTWLDLTYTQLYERALRHRCRTHNFSHADLFWVAAFHSEIIASPPSRPDVACAEQPIGSVVHETALFERLERAAPGALAARGGADHILFSPRIGAAWEATPLCESPPLWAEHLPFTCLSPAFHQHVTR